MTTLHITEGDTDPDLSTTLTHADGTAVDLTNATVEFSVAAPRGHGNVFTKACTVTDATNGKVAYTWDTADTSTPGRFRAKFVVTYGSGDVEHFPNDDTHTLIIHRQTEAV